MRSARTIGREIGTALAVLAIYLLTVLTPLHQARASQLAFEELGYTILESGWTLCSSADVGQDERAAPLAKCPAAGVGKSDLVLPTIAVLELNVGPAPASALAFERPIAPFTATPPIGPRGPPALV